MRVSVFDQRLKRTPAPFGPWVGCTSACGAGQTKKRTRECPCPSEEDNACFDCEVETEEELPCDDTSLCEFSEYTDFGNCVFHSDCCETITVKSHEDEIGFYSKIYAEQQPYAVYKKVAVPVFDEPVDPKYIHYRSGLQQWVISNNYWSPKDCVLIDTACTADKLETSEKCNTECDSAECTAANPGAIADYKCITVRDISLLSEITSESCPSNITVWNSRDITSGTVKQEVEVTMTCDPTGSNRCNSTHPFAYNDGADCCASPFEDFNDALGRDCDGSPISIESKCCLNAYQ